VAVENEQNSSGATCQPTDPAARFQLAAPRRVVNSKLSKGNSMSKILAALIVAAFSFSASAQAPAAKKEEKKAEAAKPAASAAKKEEKKK
jgi:hypothetical protein